MSSAVEARAATTPPAGLPPDSQIGTADPYSPRDPYGRSLLDPGSCDVSDWLGVSPAANGANDESGASGSGDAAPIPSSLSEARDTAAAYRAAIWVAGAREQPLRQLVARVRIRVAHHAERYSLRRPRLNSIQPASSRGTDDERPNGRREL